MTFPRWLGVLAVLGGVTLNGCKNEFTPGTIYPNMSLAPPSPLEFGRVVANEETKTVDLTISNVERANLEIQDMVLGDPAFTMALPEGVDLSVDPLVIAPDESVTVPVTFTPTEIRSYNTTLVFTTNEEKPETVMDITAEGRPPYAPDIEIRVKKDPASESIPSLSVDYGDVSGQANQILEIWNVGDADLELGSIVREGSAAFGTSFDPSGILIAPGASNTLIVTYTPFHDGGDSGTFTIPNNDPDEDPTVVTFEARGGGDFIYPEAVVGCPGDIDLAEPQLLTFDGSASNDPVGGTLTYEWALIQKPDGVDDDRTVDPIDQPATELWVDAAGTWEVSLTVHSDRDGDGTPEIPSLPAKCTFQAKPLDNIHVELNWGGSTSDFDLHLAQEDAAFFSVPGEVSWCNTNPDWGISGDTSDDGHLTLDNTAGPGPEIAGITIPQDGTYYVRVHAFDDGDDGAGTATVTIQLNGEQKWTGSRVMNRNEVWEVGQINWPDATFGVNNDNDNLWDAAGVRSCQQ